MSARRAIVLLALAGVVAAGCGSNAPSATSTGSKPTARAKAVRFAACIRAHGVADFPDPNAHNGFDYGVSVSPAVWRAAVQACHRLQPPGTLSGKRTTAQQSAALRFARCIRGHGVKDFPDPVNGDPLVDTTKIPSTDAPGGMTVLNAAMQACKALVAEAAGRR